MTTRIQTFGGNIGIGTDDPGSYKLNVNGIVKANSLVVNGVTNSGIPIGLIEMWSGTVATIPEGWALCNGQSVIRSDNGASITTPNLTNLFVRGAVGDNPSLAYPGQSGGSNNATISTPNLTNHTHTFTTTAHNTTHSHGNVTPVDFPHSHGLTTSSSAHGHPSSQANAPHSHSTGSENAPHEHGDTQTTQNPHSHTLDTGQATHNHPFTGANVSLAGGGPRSVRAFPGTNTTTTSSNMNHSHTIGTGNSPHRHNYGANNMSHDHNSGTNNNPHSHNTANNSTPHTHPVVANNAAHTHPVTQTSIGHTHTGTTGSTGQGTAFSITNPYYVLAYIMKY